MITKIVKVDKEHPDEAVIKEAGEILKNGGLVAFPTETVYGLGGDGLNARSFLKIYHGKCRSSVNPLIIHFALLVFFVNIAFVFPVWSKKLADKYWPGPLTMIFKKKDIVPIETTGGLESVAVRMPSHKVARALICYGGKYVAAPSANTSGRPSPTLAEHVIEDLNGKVDMILDGGEVGIGLESTIVDFTEKIPVILRPGYINQKMIAEVIGEVRMDKGLLITDASVRPKAPGMKYRHYAPRAELTIIEGETEAVVAAINEKCRKAEAEGLRVGVIGTDETKMLYHASVVKSIGSRQDEESIGLHLFRILREFDSENVNLIFSESFDTPNMGQAIMNRLLKAAGHHVIKV